MLPAEGPFAAHIEAMRYSLFAGGKRVRPILCIASCEAVGGDSKDVLPAAIALECIHTYSLIHDDLPAMDDDELRRGRPTCHKKFGEAIAILAGDGLLTYAFELMTHPSSLQEQNPTLVSRAIQILARAAGVHGMVGGQTADILMEGKDVDGHVLNYIHEKKTGALIEASVELGGVLAGAPDSDISRLKNYGKALGLAFQIVDDILDIEGDEKVIGKPVGSDLKKSKATYPAIHGLDAAKKRALSLRDQALEALESFDEKAEPLRAIAKYVVDRNR